MELSLVHGYYDMEIGIDSRGLFVTYTKHGRFNPFVWPTVFAPNNFLRTNNEESITSVLAVIRDIVIDGVMESPPHVLDTGFLEFISSGPDVGTPWIMTSIRVLFGIQANSSIM
jgi:hypothetical protein